MLANPAVVRWRRAVVPVILRPPSQQRQDPPHLGDGEGHETDDAVRIVPGHEPELSAAAYQHNL